jgi:hypothetical protein
VRPFCHVLEVHGRGAGLSAKHDDLGSVFERKQGGHQPFNVAPNARRGRGERASIDTDAQTSLIRGLNY